jgi:hypothetical protein
MGKIKADYSFIEGLEANLRLIIDFVIILLVNLIDISNLLVNVRRQCTNQKLRSNLMCGQFTQYLRVLRQIQRRDLLVKSLLYAIQNSQSLLNTRMVETKHQRNKLLMRAAFQLILHLILDLLKYYLGRGSK